jgi:Zn-finger nucleic acid-binding protein
MREAIARLPPQKVVQAITSPTPRRRGSLGMNGEHALSRQTGEPMRCPTCGSRLVEVERSSVLIDAPELPRGVAAAGCGDDRGELDKILVQERQMTAGDPDDDFLREVEGRRRSERDYHEHEHSRDYGGHHGKGKRRRRVRHEPADPRALRSASSRGSRARQRCRCLWAPSGGRLRPYRA